MERKPVNCGCGGEVWAFMTLYPENRERPYICQCRQCFTRTGGFPTEKEAIEAWNRAMGSTEKSSTVKRTSKVEILLCGNCHESNVFDVVTRQHYKYCPNCGCRLEWE